MLNLFMVMGILSVVKTSATLSDLMNRSLSIKNIEKTVTNEIDLKGIVYTANNHSNNQYTVTVDNDIEFTSCLDIIGSKISIIGGILGNKTIFKGKTRKIYISGGQVHLESLYITKGIFYYEHGGGIYISSGTVTIISCEISSNSKYIISGGDVESAILWKNDHTIIKFKRK